MDWPVREGRLVSNFGGSDRGIPLVGDAFASPGPVYPAEVGKLVFVHDPAHPAVRFPSPLGSWMAVDHGENMVGIYGRFEDRRGAPPAMVERNTVLANAGKTGWTEQSGLYFSFFDRKERRWVNPALLLAGREDTIPPVIRQVELRSAAGTPYNPAQIQRLPQGLYTVFVDASDSAAGETNLAPNRLSCSINGVEAGALSFETLVSREGRRMVYRQGLVPAEGVYDGRGFGLGEIRLSRGQVTIVVEARDMAGNSRGVTYRLSVD
ncbi:MAG: hypothetical protein LBD09_00685 [Treponema sp.]|nr:hypothetical protein [Treponema sp.]